MKSLRCWFGFHKIKTISVDEVIFGVYDVCSICDRCKKRYFYTYRTWKEDEALWFRMMRTTKDSK